MHKTLIPFLLFLTLNFVLVSCFTTANFETGKTLGKGNRKVDVAVNNSQFKPKTTGMLPYDGGMSLNLGVSYGLTDKLDIGMNSSTNSDISFKAKFMLTKPASKLALSIGASSFIMLSIPKPMYLHSNIALYTSFHPNKRITFYAYPQLLFISPQEKNIVKTLIDSRGISFSTGILLNHYIKNSETNDFSIGFEYSNVSIGIFNQNTFSVGIILKDI